jgi:hypothetical protein
MLFAASARRPAATGSLPHFGRDNRLPNFIRSLAYSVVLRHDRVELLRQDPAGEEPVTLTRTQWALLDGTRAFSADEAEQT